ncbi:MAG TPA: hypothetical protein VN758_10165 [Solirubrobacterales bacterium]|nr:hypothetical protein [Solirubrobacterales bacterium]
MTAPELIELSLFATRFRTPLSNQFRNRIAAFCCLSESTPKTFERSQAGFQQQPIVLDASNEGVALTEAELFALPRRNHDAPLFTDPHFCHQDLNVAEVK